MGFVPSPRPPSQDDDFNTPEVRRIVAAGSAVLGAAVAAFWAVAFTRAGCIPSGCDDDDGAPLGFLVWFATQFALLLPTARGLFFLLTEEPRHRTPITISVLALGITTVLVVLGIASYARSS